MRRPTENGPRHGWIALLAVTALAGCGGESDDELHDGVYEFELTEAYLRESGIPRQQARAESGLHKVTLDRGSFVERWRAPDGTVASCVGVYTLEGRRAAFRWTDGCTGDWAMSYSLDGDSVVWSDVEVLDPDAGAQEQRVAEVFSGVPWTRTADVPQDG